MPDSNVGLVRRMRPSIRTTDPAERSCANGIALLILVVFAFYLPGCAWVREIASNPDEESRRLTQRARDAADSTNFARANELLDRAEKLTPHDPDVHRQRARALLAQGRRRQAVEALSHAVEYDRDDIGSRIELARLLIEEGLPAEAGAPLDRVLEIDPRHVDALMLKAKLAEQNGEPDVALETYHRVLGCDGEQVEARLALARLQVATGRWERATPLLRAICDCPRSTPGQRADAKWSLGIAYGRESLWKDAARELSESAEFRTDLTADDWYRLAYAHLHAEDYERAWTSMSKALEKSPHHEPSLAMSAFFQAYGWNESRTMPQPIVPATYSASGLPAPQGW